MSIPLLVMKLFEFLGLLRESYKIFSKNVKALFYSTLLSILLSSFILVMNSNSLKPILTEVVIKARILAVKHPSTAEKLVNLFTAAAYDCGVFLGIEWIFMLGLSLSEFFASVESYRGKDLSIKKLLPQALKALKRPVFTWFYITLLDLGYFLFLLAFLLPLVLIFNLKFTIYAFTIIAALLALVVRIYLAAVWKLAIIVSILEEKCGIEARRKAGQLIKGSKLRGFFLNLVLTISWWVVIVMYMIAAKVLESFLLLLFINCILCIIIVASRISFTFLYYESKATHGEKPELHGSLEYTKITSSATPPINEDAV